MATRAQGMPGWLKTGILLLAGALLIGLVIWLIRGFLADSTHAKKPSAQVIAVLKPPPPPPKPKPEEKPPEPETKREEVKMAQPTPDEAPKPAQSDAPAGKDLGVDAEGGAGDSFGLAGRKGGRDLLAGGGGSPFAFYTNALQKTLQEELARSKALGGRDYRVAVMLWLDSAGKIEKFTLSETSGNPETDRLLRGALAELPRLQTPPENMPRPIGVRISSRGSA